MKENWAKARAERCASAVCTGFGRISFYPAVRCGDFPVPFFPLSVLSPFVSFLSGGAPCNPSLDDIDFSSLIPNR
ncbi:MAG: hypothetical protein LBP50_01370 [Tannerella sp.]|jgi:hypothetical protein|nr:hypothetical protein [Tannerella sp.]